MYKLVVVVVEVYDASMETIQGKGYNKGDFIRQYPKNRGKPNDRQGLHRLTFKKFFSFVTKASRMSHDNVTGEPW